MCCCVMTRECPNREARGCTESVRWNRMDLKVTKRDYGDSGLINLMARVIF